jgi:hypothetical protein
LTPMLCTTRVKPASEPITEIRGDSKARGEHHQGLLKSYLRPLSRYLAITIISVAYPRGLEALAFCSVVTGSTPPGPAIVHGRANPWVHVRGCSWLSAAVDVPTDVDQGGSSVPRLPGRQAAVKHRFWVRCFSTSLSAAITDLACRGWVASHGRKLSRAQLLVNS